VNDSDQEVSIPVLAYDEHHQAVLLRGPRTAAIARLLGAGLCIPVPAIHIHAMFEELDPGKVGFRSYAELARTAANREAQMNDYFDFSGGVLSARPSNNPGARGKMVERMGVACSLLAMNEVIGATEADWRLIPASSKQKTLDFQLVGSNGDSIVSVEAKGTVVDRVDRKSPGVSKAKASIEAKKLEARSNVHVRAHEEYGVIAALSEQADEGSRIYLLDPPALGADEDPRRFKLLTRIRYYARHLALVSQFRMLLALENRVRAISEVSNYQELDGLSLVGPHGERFALPEALGNRPLVSAPGVFGRILWPRTNGLLEKPERGLFVGFSPKLFDVLASQDFSTIHSLRWTRTTWISEAAVVGVQDANGARTRQLSGSLTWATNSAGVAVGWFQPKD